jgi:poly(A) polymerase
MKVTHEILRSSLDQALEKHKVDENEKGNELRSEILNVLRKDFTSWCSEGKILSIGSYKLEVHSSDSDIDIVCLAPHRYTREEFQQEFYRKLQSVPGVTYCYGVFRAKVPLIKLIMRGVKIDMQYANTDQDLNSICTHLLDEPTLLSINAYRNNEMLLNLVPNIEKFRVLLKTVRLWAKKRGIYSGIFGFLGGAAWSILAAKICILYPSLSEIELIHKFFKVYSQWDWSIPVCLNPEQSSFSYSYHQSLMTLLTPAHPCYNTAYTLTTSSFYCIVQELELGYKITKDIIEGNQEWQTLFEEIDFFQLYKYFIKVTIHSCSANEYETWQGIVFSRIKFLLQELECIYPRPAVVMYTKPFATHYKTYKFSQSYYIGLNFNFSQTVKVDLRIPISNFCAMLNELRPNKSTMSLRIVFVPRKDLPQVGTKSFLKS